MSEASSWAPRLAPDGSVMGSALVNVPFARAN